MIEPPIPKGHKPGSTGADVRGLKVEYSSTVAEVETHGYGKRTKRFSPPGWFVWVKFLRGPGTIWEAVLALRFVREIDAIRAAASLIAAGLDSAKRMKLAGAERVIRTAYDGLQW